MEWVCLCIYTYIHTRIHMHILYYIDTYTYTHNGLLLNLKKEILIYLTTWITLKDILGSHTSQQQKDKDYLSSYLWGISRNQTHRNKIAWWLPGSVGTRMEFFDGYRVSVLEICFTTNSNMLNGPELST